MPASYDVIVLGLGGMGSSALWELTQRGHRVLGIEQFPLVHARGSSHGQTRIIREAYYEHPNYVPLIRRAYEKWYDLEQRVGRHLLTSCECLNIGAPGSAVIEGVRAAARQHALSVDECDGEEIHRRYPAFRVPNEYRGIVERRAGFLYVEECVQAHLDCAIAAGAEVRAELPVVAWTSDGASVEVTTKTGTYRAAKLIITAGAWATQFLQNIGVPLSIMRQTMLWFPPHDPAQFRRDRFPIYLLDSPNGACYGLPMIDPRGMKLARHYGAIEQPTPDGIDWTIRDADEVPLRAFLDAYMPNAHGPRTHGQACMYTLTPDRHFVIDMHPQHPNVAIAAGFSGHGFKFASVVGEILADLTIHGRTPHDIQMFRAGLTRHFAIENVSKPVKF